MATDCKGEAQPHSDLTLLAVDDARPNLTLINMFVGEFYPGSTVLTAENGPKALELAHAHEPDIILLDAVMPDMNGFEVCRQLKADPKTTSIPILMISGIMTAADDKVAGLEGGADGYMCKPYEAQELVAQINAMLRMTRGGDQVRHHLDQLAQELDEETHARLSSEAKFRTLFENSPDAIFVQDEEGIILDVNPAACELHRMSREQLVGANYMDFTPEAARANAQDEYPQLFSGHLVATESARLDSHGQLVPVEIRTSRIQFNSDTAVLLHARDITDRKLAEERESELQARLIRSQRMESLGMLAGGVAHDLNNILGPIVAYPELILENMEEDNLCREEVIQMGRSASRAMAIIQDLLALARRGGYQTEPVHVNELVRLYETSPEFREQQSLYPNVSVATHLESELPHIVGSTSHMMQVIMNLTHNAFEAMPQGGRVSISTTCEFVDAREGVHDSIPASDYVVLRVADRGAGITPLEMEHIFEPFYTKKEMGRSGSGLGLPVVYGVVKDLKGYIDVQAHPGHGTEFSLYFPIAPSVAARTRERDKLDLRGTESILVVDDVDEQRTVAAKLLGSLGYKVSAVRTGNEAIDFVTRDEVDLIVLDMILQDNLDGLDTYREVLKIRPGQRCIIVSGFSETNRVRKAQTLGAGSYVRKPYTRSRLGRAVREELGRRLTIAA